MKAIMVRLQDLRRRVVGLRRAIVVGFGRVLSAPDNRDWHVYGGLMIAGVGGWLLSPAWTFIAIGGALVLFGLFGGLLDRLMERTEDR